MSFDYRQIWLNILMDDCQFSTINEKTETLLLLLNLLLGCWCVPL
jgi:hypothetical protein